MDAPPSLTLADSYAFCRGITKQRARNFYLGLRLTPEPRRSAVFAVYALMRALDDATDDEGEGEAESRDRERANRLGGVVADLDRAWEVAHSRPGLGGGRVELCGPLWPAVVEVLRRYPIRRDWLDAMVEGQRRDLCGGTFPTLADLTRYAEGVASSVGLICITIWGHAGGETTYELARRRGVAMQLTNILRDVREDAFRGRLYLPVDWVARAGLNPADALAAVRSPSDADPAAVASLAAALAALAAEAERMFRGSAELEARLDPACRGTSWAMMRVYRDLLGAIAADPLRVLRERVTLSRPRKLSIAAAAAWRGWRASRQETRPK